MACGAEGPPVVFVLLLGINLPWELLIVGRRMGGGGDSLGVTYYTSRRPVAWKGSLCSVHPYTVLSRSYGLQTYSRFILGSISVGKRRNVLIIVSIFQSIRLQVMVSSFREHQPFPYFNVKRFKVTVSFLKFSFVFTQRQKNDNNIYIELKGFY